MISIAVGAPRTRRRLISGIVAGVIFIPVVFAAMWPVTFDSREELFEIPKGTWARRMAGEKREILPSEFIWSSDS